MDMLEQLELLSEDKKGQALLAGAGLCSACYGLQRPTESDIPLFCLFVLDAMFFFVLDLLLSL